MAMQIMLVGISYKTSPVCIRERLAFNPDETAAVIKSLKSRFGGAEFVLLSTCNRTELYCVAESPNGPAVDDIIKSLADVRNVAAQDFQRCVYVRFDAEAVNHLLTVSSSLDSMVVGEPQIIGQVKDSYGLACNAKSTGKILNKLFHFAFATAKMIYSDTSIASRRVSVAGVAVELAKQLFADIATAKILVIGAGDMGQILIERLVDLGCRRVTLINRTHSHCFDLAAKCNVAIVEWEQMERQLMDAHIVVASVAAQEYLFSKSEFNTLLQKRGARPLLMIDIAVPRCFDPAINELDNVHLYNIDDLAQVVERNFKLREGEIDQAVEIISRKQSEFMEWFNCRELGPLIGQMKKQFDRIIKKELDDFFAGAGQDTHNKEEIHAIFVRIVNRFMHCIISNVKATAKERGAQEAINLANYMIRQTGQAADNEEYPQEKCGTYEH